MSRFRKNDNAENPVSLFPFLAVLLCTMGMLVMLLVLISQGTQRERTPQSKREIASNSKPLPDPSAPIPSKEKDVPDEKLLEEYGRLQKLFGNMSLDNLREELGSGSWYLEELKEINKKNQESLKQERDRLAANETAISTRFRELARLREDLKLMVDSKNKHKNADNHDKELQEATNKNKSLKEEIEKLKQEKDRPRNSFAVLPYQGKSGTFRRPIYIECTATGVYLMPEGIAFSYEDFLMAKYPGNPFDTAIRTARSCMMEKNPTQEGQQVEPYPLLIIRPGGADKYYIAMAALASWGGEFGYEFVEDDWEIEYPPTDPELAERVKQQVSFARYKLAIPLAALLAERERSGNGNDEGFSAGRHFLPNATSNNTGLKESLGDNVKLASVGSETNATGSALPSGNGMNGGSDLTLGGGFGNSQWGDGPVPGGDGTGMRGSNLGGTGRMGSGLTQSAAPADLYGSTRSGNKGFIAESYGLSGNELSSGSGFLLPKYSGIYNTPSGSGAGGELSGNGFPQGAMAGQNGTENIAGNGQPSSGMAGTSMDSTTGSSAGRSNMPFVSNTTSSGTRPTGTNVPARTTNVPGGNEMPSDSSMATASSSSGTMSPLAAKIADPRNQTASSNTSSDIKDQWSFVGNTAYAQGASGSVAEGSLTPTVGADSSAGPVAANEVATLSSDTMGQQGSMAVPTATFEKKKIQEEAKKKDEKPAYAGSGDFAGAINLTEQARQPVHTLNERPVRVICYADRIVLPKQPGLKSEIVVTMTNDTSKTKNELLEAVAFCVRSWGVAGRNMYWTPWLKVSVESGGQPQFDFLQLYFRPQGINVKQD